VLCAEPSMLESTGAAAGCCHDWAALSVPVWVVSWAGALSGSALTGSGSGLGAAAEGADLEAGSSS
jgi:hypothetical protein